MTKYDEIQMFKHAAMIKSLAFCAATFACVSVLFKNSIVFIPEVTEVRLCNILTCCYGIWFGPAGAWGCAIGNLVGDLGGSLTILSFGGFAANFFSAYLPYKVWERMGKRYGEHQFERPSVSSKKWALRYFAAGLASVIVCSIILGITFAVTGTMSFINTFALIFCNNMAATTIGLMLFLIMEKVPSQVLPYWRDLMLNENDRIITQRDEEK